MSFLAGKDGVVRAASSRASSPGPQGMMRGLFAVGQTDPPIMGTRDLLEGYESMPWLRAVSGRVAVAVAGTHWKVLAVKRGGKIVRVPSLQRAGLDVRQRTLKALRDQGELVEIEEHPFYDAMEYPNPFMDRRGLVAITTLHLDMIGDAYWLKERNGMGKPVGFWPVPPHWVMENPVPGRPTYRIGWKSWQVVIPETEMHRYHDPAPADPYSRGSGIGWSVGDELEVDEYASKMAKALFFNRARPDFLFWGGEGSSREEVKRLERDWNNRLQGFAKAHKPYFMSGGEGKASDHIHEFQQPTMEQLVYPNLRKIQRDIVMQTRGVPPEMFGISEKGTLAQTNYEAAEYLFCKWVVNPRAEDLRCGLQRLIATEWDERAIVDFDSHVAQDKVHELNARKALPFAYTVDEHRAVAGEPPLPGGKGQVFLVPSNYYPAQDPADIASRQQAAPPKPPGEDPGDDPEKPPKPPAEEEDDAA